MADQKDTYTANFSYQGGLNSDDHPLNVPKGDSIPNNGIGSFSISTINTNGNNDGVVFPINGNALSFALPVITTQNKIYQFSITSPSSNNNTYSINFNNVNYTLIANVTLTTTEVIATDAAALSVAITSALSAYAVSISYVISGHSATFTLSLTGMLGFDWLMVDNPVLVIIDSGNSFTGFSAGNTITDVTTSELLGTVLSTITGTLILTNISGFNIGSPTDELVNQSSNSVTLNAATGIFSLPTNPIVTQEAIDRSLTDFNKGYCLPIGGIEYLGDLFIFSTCQGNTPQSFAITNAVSSAGKIQVTISGNQVALFPQGESVNIDGVNGVNANGVWSVLSSVVSGGNTNIILYNTTFSGTYTSGGTISIYNNGFLNISVHKKNQTTGIWTNFSLLSTKSMNSRFYNPIRKNIVANKNNNILAIYWVDGNDYDRVFKYTGVYLTNGAIEFYNPNGLYTYDSVSLETRGLRNIPTSIVKIFSVQDSGGEALSGNWRFTVQPLDSSLTAGQISLLSNPVNVYNGNFGQPANILGTPGAKSSMTVTVQVTDIPLNVFSYFNLIGVNYVGDTETVYLIKRVPVPQNTTTLNITYTGLEVLTAYTDGFDFPSLSYISSKTQTVCSNSLVKANLTAAAINDYSAFAQLWTHALKRGTSLLKPLGDDVTGYTLGEYQVPLATSQSVSAMLNETYRIMLVPELLAGAFLPPFWCDDIRFDLNSTNVANPFGNANRRTGNQITSYDLSQSPANTAASAINSYVFYLTLTPPVGWQNYLIDGVPLNQVVKRIHIFRVDNEAAQLNEVLACGLGVRHCLGTATISGSVSMYGYPGVGAANYIYDNPFLLKGDIGALPALGVGANVNSDSHLFSSPSFKYAGTPYASTINPPGNTPAWAQSFSFYSPDIIYGQMSISLLSGDCIFSHGQPDWDLSVGNMDLTVVDNIDSTVTEFRGSEIRLSGATGITTDDWNNNQNAVQYYSEIPDFAGNVLGLPDSLIYCSGNQFINTSLNLGFGWDTPHHAVLYCNSVIAPPNSYVNDIGTYYIQYYRNLGSVTAASNAANYPNNTKFGAIETDTSMPTGAYIDVSSTVNSVDVFGWDTFNTKSFLKLQYPIAGFGTGNLGELNTGGGVTCVFVCQNRMNFNMRNPGNLAYPQTPPIQDWINWSNATAIELDRYDAGYTPRDPDCTLAAYDPALPYVTVMPEREIYSLFQPQNSVTNNWEIYPPLNFYDLSSNKGYITNLFTSQGELFSLQQRALLRNFFNEVGTMNVGEASTPTEVALGSSTPFTKPPDAILPNIGNSNNLGFLTGVDTNGRDLFSWIDIATKQVILMHSNGEIEIISLTKKMRTFFDQWVGIVLPDTD